MGILREIFGPSKAEIWSQLSREIGVDYHEEGILQGCMTLNHREWQIVLDTYTVGSGDESTTYTRMRAPFVNRDDFHFRIHRKGIFSGLGLLLGGQDIKIGDPFFDDEFIVQGEPEALVRILLSNEEIRRHIGNHQEILIEIKKDDGLFEQTFPEGVHELHFQAAGVIKDKECLKDLFELFALILDELCRMGSAYQKPAALPAKSFGNNDPGCAVALLIFGIIIIFFLVASIPFSATPRQHQAAETPSTFPTSYDIRKTMDHKQKFVEGRGWIGEWVPKGTAGASSNGGWPFGAGDVNPQRPDQRMGGITFSKLTQAAKQDEVSFSFSLEKTSFRIGEPIIVTVKASNPTARKVTLLSRWAEPSICDFNIWDGNQPLAGANPPSPSRAAVTIPPRSTIRWAREDITRCTKPDAGTNSSFQIPGRHLLQFDSGQVIECTLVPASASPKNQ